MVTRHSFDQGLDDLHLDLIKMGSLVEESIDNTILALKKQDMGAGAAGFYKRRYNRQS